MPHPAIGWTDDATRFDVDARERYRGMVRLRGAGEGCVRRAGVERGAAVWPERGKGKQENVPVKAVGSF